MATVAVVNDDADAREIVARVIERDGHTVLRVDDAASASQAVGDGRPTLAVIDIHHGGPAASRTLLGELRAEPESAAVRAVLVGRSEGAGLLAFQAGADGFLVRPFHVDDLCRAIDEALARPDAEREPFRAAQVLAIAAS